MVCIQSKENRRRESGAVFIETAISMIVFAIVLIGGLDLSIMAFRYSSLQHIANETLRWTTINSVDPAIGVVDAQNKAHTIASAMGVPIEIGDTKVCLQSDHQGSAVEPKDRSCNSQPLTTGEKRDYVVVQIEHYYSGVLGLFDKTLKGTAIGRIEE